MLNIKNLYLELKVAMKALENAAKKIKRDLLELKNIQISSKITFNFIGKIDLKIEDQIIKTLQLHRPNYSIFSKERGFLQSIKKSQSKIKYHWIIDPIDGIFNCMHAIPFFCISIALVEINHKSIKTVIGIVFNPSTNEVFYALDKIGAFSHDINQQTKRTRMRLAQLNNFENFLCIINKKGIYKDQIINNYLYYLNSIYDSLKNATFRKLGSLALELSYLADGRINFVIQSKANICSYIAAALIIKEAKGKILNLNFNKINMNAHYSSIIAGDSRFLSNLKILIYV